MKKIYFIALLVLLHLELNAQPWMPTGNNGPLKFSDMIARYRQMPEFEEEEHNTKANLKERGEGKEHLFQKWEWYWRQHLDKDGYIVPQMKTTEEWQRYFDMHKYAARTTTTTSNWIFQGPSLSGGGYAGIGRLTVVAFDPVDSNTFYVGSPGGSAWKTTNGGLTWASLYDHLPTLGVSDIKINPLNRNTIYLATGDGDHGDAYSSGIIKSHDGGLTWATTGLSWPPTYWITARSLLINPQDTNSMILATNNGIYKTHDGGVTWINYTTGDYKQILYKPGDTSTVYGTIYTSTSAQIVRSLNGGITWSTVTAFTDAQRVNIAICPSSPAIVKAIASNSHSGLQGIYNSTNSGASYTALFTDDTTCTNNLLNWELGLPTSGCGGQGWYDLCIAMNPANASEVTIGGVNTYFSSDGGLSWTIANTWWGGLTGVYTVHADKHNLAYHPLTGALFETCDGGVYKNYGPLTDPWTDLSSGICVTEFYRNAVANGTSFCIGGCQDDGTKMVLGGGASTDLTGGDGMQPLINYGDPNNVFYCSYQNGAIDMTRDGGANYHSITDTLHSSGGWVTPYVIHPADTATLLLGYKRVFVSHNNGNWWTPVSPIFDSNSNLNILQISRANPNYIYTVHDDYNIWKSVIHYTTNFGASWDTIHNPIGNFISDLAIDPRNEKHLWVTVSGYSSTDKVYSYNLVTNTWTNETGSLPNLPVDCIVIDTSSKTKYIGTDAAIFYKDSTMTDWMLYNNNLPSVHVADLNINYSTGEIWAATFGRGMWKSYKAENPPSLFVPKVPAGDISIAPNPGHGVFTIHTTNTELLDGPVVVKLVSVDGRIVWSANGLFDGGGNLQILPEGLRPGFYICEVSNKNGVLRSRVVVN